MEPRLVVTPLDYVADTYGIVRFRGESDENFKNRLRGFFRRSPDHTYRGLVEAASLELGIPVLPFIDITSTVPSSSVIVSPTGITMENDLETLVFQSFTLDVSGNWEIVSGFTSLTSGISSSSTFSFSQPITYYNQEYPRYNSAYVSVALNPINLVHSTNMRMYTETHSINKYCVSLEYKPLRGSVVFNYGNANFYVEVDSLDEVQKDGDYYVDYDNGVLYLYGYDEFQDIEYNRFEVFQIDYSYVELPFRLYLAPIQMFSFIDPILQPFMYNVYDNKLDTWDRIEFPMVTDIINEIRTQNVNY